MKIKTSRPLSPQNVQVLVHPTDHLQQEDFKMQKTLVRLTSVLVYFLFNSN